MSKDTLEVDSVLYKVGDKSLLSDIYLKCTTGEIVGLLGRNGSGKSILLKIIFGIEHTYDKSIRINNAVYDEPYKHELIGYLPQQSFLPGFLSLKKIIKLFIPSLEKQEEVMAENRIKDHLSKKPWQLSGGELKLFETLLILNLNAPFLLLDEPFSSLEPLYKEYVCQILTNYKSKNKGIIITDHDFRNVINVSDRILLLKDGWCREIKQLEDLEKESYLPFGVF